MAEPGSEESWRLARQIVERALTQGHLDGALADRAMERIAEARAEGRAIDGAALLRDLGVPDRVADSLDLGRLIGRSIGGFSLERPLGIGGMGIVFLGRQASLDREVAVKVLDPLLAERPHVRERFAREAKVAARLSHPHVVQPIDFGEEDGLFFFVMEHLKGGSALERLEEKGPLPEREAVAITRDIAKALVYAEEVGVVHRDLKPSNILFDGHGTPKLADLGLALDVRSHATRLTAEDMIVGSPHYVAPEIILGEDKVDGRADIYGLGITLFAMLSGRPPFEGPTPTAVFTKHLTDPLPDVRTHAPGASPRVRELLSRMCAKRREARFASASALLEELERLLKDYERPEAPAPAPSSAASTSASASGAALESDTAELARRPSETASLGAPAGAPTQDDPRAERTEQTRRPPLEAAGRRRVALAGAGLLLGLAVAIALAIVWNGLLTRPDPAAEARHVKQLVFELEKHRQPEGFFAGQLIEGDAWTNGEALRALILVEDAETRGPLEPLLGVIERAGRRAGDPPRFDGFPYFERDTTAVLEMAADVGVALALCHGRVDQDLGPRMKELLEYLARTQNPDGSWSTLPAAGQDGSMTAATAMGLDAFVCLATALGAEREHAPHAARAAIFLARMYQKEEGFFDVNPRRRFGSDRLVPGVSERAIVALLDARALLRRVGASVPAHVDEVLTAYAERFEPTTIAPETLGAGRPEDLIFDRALPEGHTTSLRGYRWVPYAWRLIAARSLASAQGIPRADDWGEEAARLRAMLPELPHRFEGRDAWQIAEVLFAIQVVRRAEGEPPLLSLVRRP